MKYIIVPNNLRWLNGWCSAFLNDVKVTLKSDGWYVSQKELAAVGLVHLKMGDLKVEDFTEDAVVAYGTVNMGDFLKDVGDSKLDINLKEGMFYIEAEDLERKLTLVDGSGFTIARRPNIESLLVTVLTIDLTKLKRAIKAAKRLADFATFEIEGGTFRVKARKETGDEVTLKTPAVGDKWENCHSNFSLVYLEKISGLLQGKVTISFGTDCPILFHDEISEHSYADFYLAPRVESE